MPVPMMSQDFRNFRRPVKQERIFSRAFVIGTVVVFLLSAFGFGAMIQSFKVNDTDRHAMCDAKFGANSFGSMRCTFDANLAAKKN
jgi:hypothetical protein